MSALGIDVGTFLDKGLDDFEVATKRGGLEGIAVVSTLGIDICSFISKYLHNFEVTSS